MFLEQHVSLSDNQAGKFEKERDGKNLLLPHEVL